jgi:hypothetical protein
MSNWKESRIIVGQEEGAKRQVVAYVGKDGKVGMHVHDLGDREYEYDLWVNADKKDKLVLVLIEHLYGERQSCASGFEALMKENAISCERRGDWKESKTIVARGNSPHRRVLAFVGKDDRVGLQVHELGGPRGREDYQFYVDVPGDEKDRLIIALMAKIYGHHDSCPSEFEVLMQKNEISWERHVI